MSQWNDSAQGMLRNKQQYGDRVCIILFEDLNRSTEAVMRYLANFLGIGFDSILLTPTFNRSGVRTLNYAEMAEGPQNNPLLQSDAAQFEKIDVDWNQTLDEYEAVLSKSVQF